MKIEIISVFPEIFAPVFSVGMARLARERGLVEVVAHDLRDFTHDKHRQVDDVPYGGGPGMVMKPDIFMSALGSVLGRGPWVLPKGVRTVLLAPTGERLTQKVVEGLATADTLVLLCGRYEGVDARVSTFVTDEISIGDYVLSGGELAAMVLADAVSRLIVGVLGAEASLVEESFTASRLEYPQYTRPASWCGLDVPDVLTSGNHGAVERWRDEESFFRTKVRRPDLLSPAEDRPVRDTGVANKDRLSP